MTNDEAIKIIKTEMECVSRPDCDRLACAYCDLAMRAEDILTAYQMALTALQTDGDCISRQGALDDIETVDPSMLLDVNWVKNWVKALPSVQPEVIRCRDCKYASPNGVYGCRLERFSAHDEGTRMFADDYCSQAERRTDE